MLMLFLENIVIYDNCIPLFGKSGYLEYCNVTYPFQNMHIMSSSNLQVKWPLVHKFMSYDVRNLILLYNLLARQG